MGQGDGVFTFQTLQVIASQFCSYLFTLVGQFIDYGPLQDQCCQLIPALLKILKDNQSKYGIDVLGEQLQFLVSKLVDSSIPSKSDLKHSLTQPSEALSLLHDLVVDSDPSLQHIKVKREKISERMKFLQDLVPGCNKFLSMKLATVNPAMDVSMEALLSKDMFRSRVPLPTSMNPFDASTQQFPFGFQSHNAGILLNGSDNHYYNGGNASQFNNEVVSH